MQTTYETQKIQLTAQILKLFIQHEDEYLKKHYKLYDIDNLSFCINITYINDEGIWFTTYYKNSENVQSQLQSHKVYGKQSHHIVERILIVIKDELMRIEAFNCEKTSVPKRIEKTEIKLNNDNPIVRRRKLITNDVNVNKEETHLRIPSNAKERQEAKLERKIFNNSKMWKWKNE